MLGAMKAKVAFLGALGIGAVAYAAFRRPRYLYDGSVVTCEGSEPVFAIEQDCDQLVLKRGSRSGKVYAPFTGTLTAVETWEKPGFIPSPVLVLKHETRPVIFRMVFDKGAPMLDTVGTRVLAGDMIGQTERLRVSAARLESGKEAPMPPSAWLVANGLLPASVQGQNWCEDERHQIVPRCPGVTFRAPELPRWSLRSVRMEIL
jgi:hypothetical protein